MADNQQQQQQQRPHLLFIWQYPGYSLERILRDLPEPNVLYADINKGVQWLLFGGKRRVGWLVSVN